MVSRALDFVLPAAALDAPAPLGLAPLTRAEAAETLYRIDLLRRDHRGFFGFFQ